MLYRKFYEELRQWHDNDNKVALLVDGARQIGKTTLIRQFGKDFYGTNFAEVNFIETPSAIKIFEGDLSADLIITRLTAFLRRPLKPHQTLLFFDEIQECPHFSTAIKFLVEDGRFDYIESGSLLGTRYRKENENEEADHDSNPVGFEEERRMYPMDFEEFCLASGVQPSTIETIRTCYKDKTPVDPFIHENMMRLFTYYIVVGGMPAAVKEFVKSKDVGKILKIQRGIIRLYRKDIIKYSLGQEEKVTRIFDTIPSELNAKNKRFMLTDLAKSARLERYKRGFNWLIDAGVGLPCYNISEPKSPLEINKKHSLFELFLNDSGLLCNMCDNNIQYAIINGEYGVNEGSIMENLVATQLAAKEYQLYYYDKNDLGEIDFVVEDNSRIIPIEVKSGKDYKSHKALDNLLKKDEYKIEKAIVLSRGNLETDGKIIYLPLYMVMFMDKEKVLDKIKFDLSFR